MPLFPKVLSTGSYNKGIVIIFPLFADTLAG